VKGGDSEAYVNKEFCGGSGEGADFTMCAIGTGSTYYGYRKVNAHCADSETLKYSTAGTAPN